jgi:predicted N-formylglutamate amidohydrolase
MHGPLERVPAATAALLGGDDPPPFELVNGRGRAPLVVVCDHGGRAIPKALGGLGLAARELDRHIAYDIGAEGVARILAARLDAPAVVCRYSRLVVDPNRAPGSPESVVAASDGTAIPGNLGLSEEAAEARLDAIFWPYHRAVAGALARQWRASGRPPALFSVHSFTPVYGGRARPWAAGVLWNRDMRIAVPLLTKLGERSGLPIGDNEPYSGRSHAYTIDVHGGVPGLANCGIEIRQDQVETEAGIERWGALLADALRDILADQELFREQRF